MNTDQRQSTTAPTTAMNALLGELSARAWAHRELPYGCIADHLAAHRSLALRCAAAGATTHQIALALGTVDGLAHALVGNPNLQDGKPTVRARPHPLPALPPKPGDHQW